MLKKNSQAIIAFLLGAFAVLGFAPYYIFPASIIALTGLFCLLHRATTPKAAFKLGFQFGLGLYITGIYWIYISLHDFGGMPWWFAGFCTFCLCAFMALFPALVTYFSKRLGFLMISGPVLWGLSDWIRSWIFTGFPWLTIGYSQVPHSPLAGFMPIVGVYGVSIMSAFFAAMLASALVEKHHPIWKRNVIVTTTLIIVSGFLLKAVTWTSPVGTPIKTSLIQGNIAQSIKWSPGTVQSTINQYMAMVEKSDSQLIVLPETALPITASQLDDNIKNKLIKHAKNNNGNIIAGMVAHNKNKLEYFNSALSFGTAPSYLYSKNHLVPFGEFIPLKQVFGWIYRDWLNMPLSDLSRGGTQQTPMMLNDQAIAINICYEDVFGEEIIYQLPEATLLVNISNDAWYGKSFAAHQHMQFSQARAIETGRMMLRATNTGATAAIDPHGYVLAHAPHDVATTLEISAQGYTGSTPYIVWGNWPFIIFCFSALALLWRRKNK